MEMELFNCSIRQVVFVSTELDTLQFEMSFSVAKLVTYIYLGPTFCIAWKLVTPKSNLYYDF